ncbi:hypothetical protein [Photorhabdus heterorhabditis]|uniref:Adhesin n=1 Tax=Photorhabdus heterorhabditis TaxID=880156 RepID=A0A5B0V8P8_9GAMM|nr:hypothetical protein [Photorhabdus heterorhabditis]KAA1170970.1 hypothetical protein F0L16_22140 [Photorhabdus heterorhabditis]
MPIFHQVIAEDTLTLNSGQLDNTAGLLQAGGEMSIDTHGHWLDNAATTDKKGGRLLSGGHLTLRTGDITAPNNTRFNIIVVPGITCKRHHRACRFPTRFRN